MICKMFDRLNRTTRISLHQNINVIELNIKQNHQLIKSHLTTDQSICPLGEGVSKTIKNIPQPQKYKNNQKNEKR